MRISWITSVGAAGVWSRQSLNSDTITVIVVFMVQLLLLVVIYLFTQANESTV